MSTRIWKDFERIFKIARFAYEATLEMIPILDRNNTGPFSFAFLEEFFLDPMPGTTITRRMRIVARKTLRLFWEKHPDAEAYLRAWHHDVKRAKWKTPNDIRRIYSTASFVSNNRVVFDIRGNNYRLVAAVNYHNGIVYIRFIGSHREYDKINVETI